MANIVGTQELVNGPRHLVIKLDIEGDGTGEINELLANMDNYDCPEVRLDAINGQMEGFTLRLFWDGTTEVPLFPIYPGYNIDYNWEDPQGQINPKMTGYTGDVRIRSTGLDNGDTASLRFDFFKKRIP